MIEDARLEAENPGARDEWGRGMGERHLPLTQLNSSIAYRLNSSSALGIRSSPAFRGILEDIQDSGGIPWHV